MKFNPIFKSFMSIFLSITFLAVSSGCSLFRSHNQSINISSAPMDAAVTVNGARYRTPTQVSVKRNEPVNIQCYKKGYVPYSRTIGTHINVTGILDIVGTFIFIVPCIGLFTPGAFDLDETNVNITLYKE